jgi:hypothetical protein
MFVLRVRALVGPARKFVHTHTTFSAESLIKFWPLTSHAGAVRNAHRAHGVVGDGGNLAGASGPVTIRVQDVISRRWVFVMVVDIETRQRVLRTKHQSGQRQSIYGYGCV